MQFLQKSIFINQNLQFMEKTFQKHVISDDMVLLFSYDFASFSSCTEMMIGLFVYISRNYEGQRQC